jgi:integrase
MGKNRNLKYQFKNAIDTHFIEGMDKHSLKKSGGMNGERIFSFADRKNLIDLSSNFSNYMKEQYPEIKMIRDINTSHIQDFFNSCCEDCSSQTLLQYESRFRKLERLVNSTYHLQVDFHSIVAPLSMKNGGGKIRNVMLSDEDYNKMLQTSNGNLRRALILSKEFGCRCSEIAKLKYGDIKEGGIKIVDSKGKRSRFIPIENQHQKEVIESFRQGQEGRVCPIKAESLQQAFNRQAKKQGIFVENGAFHMLRKNYATNKYQEYRGNGLSIQQALSRVSVNLGHGENRKQLMKQYICCPID